MVQWLGLCASTAEGMGAIPGQATKILHAVWPKKKKVLATIEKAFHENQLAI